jgi:hypothetical protein
MNAKGSGAWHATSASHMRNRQAGQAEGRSGLIRAFWRYAGLGCSTVTRLPKCSQVVVPGNGWIISTSRLRGRSPRRRPANPSGTSLSTNRSPAFPRSLLSRAAAETTSQHQQQRISSLGTTGLATPEALTARTPYVERPGEGTGSIQSADRKGSGVRRSIGRPSRSRNTS